MVQRLNPSIAALSFAKVMSITSSGVCERVAPG